MTADRRVPFPAAAAPQETETFTFRVEGHQVQHGTMNWAFDETYEIAGEHPAEALGKLLNEIEWGILDSERGFTIEFIPPEVMPGV